MAQYNNLKQEIDAKIFENNRQLITGDILNGVLKKMVDALGKGYQFMGLADPDTNPHTGDAKLFYLAKEVGVYEHFADLEVEPKEIAFFVYDLEWQKIAIPMSVLTDEQIAHLEGSVRFDQSQTLTEPQQTQARQNIGAVSTELMTAAILVEKQRAEAQERELQEAIDREGSRASTAESDLHNEILTERGRAEGAEAGLSARIDAIVQGRNVRDIVPNYQALLDYDTTTLGDNDIIMVLLDNTKSDHTTYYRWHTDTQSWEFIGGLAFTYTKTEIDEKFADLHIVLPVFNEQSSQELLAQVDETIRHAGADAQFKLPIPIEGMSGNVTVTYAKYNPMHTYLGVFADDRSELYHITRTLTSPRTYTCEVITKVFATADALAQLIKDLYNADPEEGEELGDIPRIDQALEGKANDVTVVHNTGDEDIAGKKTFTSQTTLTQAIVRQRARLQGGLNIENKDDYPNESGVSVTFDKRTRPDESMADVVSFSGVGDSVILDGVETPMHPQNAANKGYVDGVFNSLAEQIEDIQLFRTPNVSVYGAPRFDHGQASGFSRENYLGMPFKFDVVNQRFELTLAFVMGEDVNTPQNIMGSNFSLAFFVNQGKLNVRVSSNGTGWNIIEWEYADKTLEANHPYFVKLAFSGIRYSVELSENGIDYTEIYGIGSNQFPFARLLYLGIGNNFNNPFLGAINLNKCLLTIGSDIYWEGMISGGIPEAPADGKIYGRQDKKWVETAKKEELTELSLKVGDPSQLKTTEKSNLVGAINEVVQGSGEMLNFYTILNSNLIVRTLENIRYDVNGVPSTDSASNSWIVSTTDLLTGKRHDGFVCYDLLIIPFESINADNTLNRIDTQHIVNTNHEFDMVAMPHTKFLMIVPKSARKVVGNSAYNIFAYVDVMTEGEINKIADANDRMWLEYNRNTNNSLFRYAVNISSYTSLINPIINIGDMSYQYYNARNIRELKSHTGVYANWLLYGCSNLKRIALHGEPTDIAFMGSQCENLEVADLTLLYGHNITGTNRTFAVCPKLRSLIGGAEGDNYVVLEGLKVGLSLVVIGTALDRSSLRAVINGLADLTDGESKTLTLGATLKAKLTNEDIAIATSKNWIIA